MENTQITEPNTQELINKEESETDWIYKVEPTHYMSFNDDTGEFDVEIHLPGVPKEKIKLRILAELFDLQAKRDPFQYALTEYFPYEVKPESVIAKYENGLLHITGKVKNPMDEAVEIKLT